MAKKNDDNDNKTLTMTAMGSVYAKDGNVVTLVYPRHKMLDEIRKRTRDMRRSDIRITTPENSIVIHPEELSFTDFYDSALNQQLFDWHPNAMVTEPLFVRYEDDDDDESDEDDFSDAYARHRERHGIPDDVPDEEIMLDEDDFEDSGFLNLDEEIGTKFVLIDKDSGEQSTTFFYRNSVGQLMEIIYVLQRISDGLLDKRLHHYTFGTVTGVEKLYERFVELVESNDELEPMRRRMYFTGGLIKGYCQEKAWNMDMMLEIIDTTHFESMTVNEVIETEDDDD